MLPPLHLIQEAKKYRASFLIAISLGLVAGILGVFQARQVSKVINQVFLEKKDLTAVSSLLILLLVIVLLRAAFVYVGELLANDGARRIKQSLRHRLFSHLISLGPAFLRGEAGERDVQTGELANTAIEGVDSIEVYYSQYLPQVALAALVPVSILVFVFPSDLLSGVILLLTAPLLPLFMVLIGNLAKSYTRRQWRGLSRMSAYFLDVIQGLTTLKSFGRSREQAGIIQKVSEHYRQTTMDVLKVTFLSAFVLELIATISTAVVAVEVGLRLLYGKMAFEQAFFILLLAPEFYLPLRLLGTRFHAGMAGVEAAGRIFELLETPLPHGSQSSTISSPQPVKTAPPCVVFDKVSYTYASRHTAIRQVSFEIPAGEMTSLTGESGAGKTTLTWCLLRFLQPQSGAIYVDSKNLADIPPQQWWDSLSVVPQKPYLFNDSIAANIKLSSPSASETSLRLAAHLAHADDFIDQLPQGYETLIGERGLKLSAGQAQRIALARAFLKDAPLLVLDEATSHLDPETDALLQDSIARLCQGRTVLMIAHHRATLDRADQVVQLSQGQVVRVKHISHPAVMRSAPESSLAVPPLAQGGLTGSQPTLQQGPSPVTGSESPSIFRRLLSLLSPFTGRICLSVVLGFAAIASSIGLMATAAYVISMAALHPSIAELQVAIVGVRFFGLSRAVFRYLERLVSHDVTFRLLARWRVWFYQALEPLAPARLLQYHSGDLLSRTVNDIGTLENFYVRLVSPPIVALLVTIAMFGFMGGLGSELAWGLLGFMALAGVVLPVWVLDLSRQLGPHILQARAHLSTLMVDGIQGLPDLLACSQAHAYLQRVDQASAQLVQSQSRLARVSTLQNAIGGLVANLCMLSLLVLAGLRVSQGHLSGVLMGVVALGALMSFEALQPLPFAAQYFEATRSAARRLYELVDAEPEVQDPVQPEVLPGRGNLEVEHLSFSYPWRVEEAPAPDLSPFVLKDISFSLPMGSHLAIVGPSGSGKTSLVNLIQRYWEYHQGSICWGGSDLHAFRQHEFRQCLGIVPHDTYLFSATIKENLLIARPEATDNELFMAARAAKLHDFICSLPGGYETWIGEHGLRLSGGERQRLALARLFLRNAPVLIMDEPTANLDPATEQAVLQSIQEYSRGHSSIRITQRLVGLEAVDEIIVLRDGQLVERGSHADLLSQKGLYSRMWDLYNQVIW